MRNFITLLVPFLLCAVAVQPCRAEDEAAWKARIEAELKALHQENAVIKQENSELKKRVDAAETSKRSLPLSSALQKADRAVGSKYESKFCRLEPDLPDIEGHGFSFSGEYLLWKRAQSDHGYAEMLALRDSGASANIRSDETKFKPDYESGFRVGLDYRLPHDGWDLQALYTYFRSEENDSKQVQGDSSLAYLIISPYGATSGFFGDISTTTLTANNKFAYDVGDLELGKRFKVSDSLSVRLFGGLRAARIRDDVEIRTSQTSTAPAGTVNGVATERQELIGAGLRAGGESTWKVARGFSLFGGASASLLATKSSIKDHSELVETTFGLESFSTDKQTSVNRIVPVVQMAAGAEWEKKLNCNLNLNLRLGYEFTNWFNARITPRSIGFFESGGLSSGTEDIGLHGLTFRLRLDF